MKAAFLACLLGSLIGLAACASQDKPVVPSLEGDAVDLYVFQDDKPVRLRLHIRRRGVAYQQAWTEFVGKLFDTIDRDKNGSLGKQELKEIPTPQSLLMLARADFYGTPRMNASTRQRPELGVELVPDKVTKQGLASYYQISGMEPLLTFAESRGKQAEGMNSSILEQLDRDGDEKLSRAELQAAESSLRNLDLNHDDALTPDELMPLMPDPVPRPNSQQMAGVKPLLESQKVVLFKPGEPTGRIGFLLVNHYDKNQDQRLTPDEIGLDAAQFAALDRDRNKKLDLNELARLPEVLPLAGEIVVEPGKPVDLGEVQVRPLRASELCWRLFTTGTETEHLARTRSHYLADFDRADIKREGILDSKALAEQPALAPVLPGADRNGDSKLSRDELLQHLELLELGVGSCVVLTALDLGKSWFDVLDTNQDGKLGIREWRYAWQAVATLDQNKDDAISMEELAPLLHLQVGAGQPGPQLQLASSTVQNYDLAGSRASSSRGPLWFRKMDRNGDGYLALREFLGTRAEFVPLDEDKDGFVSPEEAEKATPKAP